MAATQPGAPSAQDLLSAPATAQNSKAFSTIRPPRARRRSLFAGWNGCHPLAGLRVSHQSTYLVPDLWAGLASSSAELGGALFN